MEKTLYQAARYDRYLIPITGSTDSGHVMNYHGISGARSRSPYITFINNERNLKALFQIGEGQGMHPCLICGDLNTDETSSPTLQAILQTAR